MPAVLLASATFPTEAQTVCQESIQLRDTISRYIADKDARIGVAVLIDNNEHTDTISVNGKEPFPMQSVYKFPAALALAQHCRDNGLSFSDTVTIYPSHLHPDTWSPMRDQFGTDFDSLRLPISEIVRYSLAESDNNAADIIFEIIGGPDKVDLFLKSKGFKDINIVDTEADMQADPKLSYRNNSTPIAMAALMDAFDRKYCLGSEELADIARFLENCETGKNRIPAKLSKDAVCGHKTGTGPVIPPYGKIMAVNDAGYVRRIDGQRYAIAVFVADSGYDIPETEAIIAHISGLVRKALQHP